jgi:hypothetical protein
LRFKFTKQRQGFFLTFLLTLLQYADKLLTAPGYLNLPDTAVGRDHGPLGQTAFFQLVERRHDSRPFHREGLGKISLVHPGILRNDDKNQKFDDGDIVIAKSLADTINHRQSRPMESVTKRAAKITSDVDGRGRINLAGNFQVANLGHFASVGCERIRLDFIECLRIEFVPRAPIHKDCQNGPLLLTTPLS